MRSPMDQGACLKTEHSQPDACISHLQAPWTKSQPHTLAHHTPKWHLQWCFLLASQKALSHA